MKLKKIKRAIVSVSDKKNLNLLISVFKKFNIEVISSGGSYKTLKKMNFNCIQVSKYTGFEETLDGRIKTLHPKIHAGILNIRKNKKHQKDLLKLNIPSIDLVIVNFYPFENKLKQKLKFKSLIENIDIGGSTLVRAAAKNFADVTVIADPDDYIKLINELDSKKGSTSLKFRKLMSAKAFRYSAYYESTISNWITTNADIKFPEKKTIHGKLISNLRYGENPHQKASLYSTKNSTDLKQIHGKKLSYNNYNDIYAALSILKSFKKKQGTVIIKHATPCGVSIEKKQIDSYRKALKCDPVSAFGGIIAFSSTVSKKLAKELNKTFFEVILAKKFTNDALGILKKRKNVRLIDTEKFSIDERENYSFIGNVFLNQEIDSLEIDNTKLKCVTIKKPTGIQLSSLRFAFNICKFVKSNAIVLVNSRSTIGIGSGQPSRLDSCKIATEKALNFVPEKIIGSVAASDAFFPFSDGIEELIQKGITAVIQPGGSINDKKVIETANKFGVAMVFTGTRHFKH